ncbi:GntR family transcriptional regulator [uncultured Jatrophihabitans sp.]
MERFGVSRGTLRRATDELARQGLLRIEPGRGTYVDQATKVR